MAFVDQSAQAATSIGVLPPPRQLRHSQLPPQVAALGDTIGRSRRYSSVDCVRSLELSVKASTASCCE
jgi:hypothetical protein